MPIGLNASILLARALSIEKRARALATSLPSALAVDMAGIELDASNIRMLLTDTLRGAYDGAAPVAELERRLTAHAACLDEAIGAEQVTDPCVGDTQWHVERGATLRCVP